MCSCWLCGKLLSDVHRFTGRRLRGRSGAFESVLAGNSSHVLVCRFSFLNLSPDLKAIQEPVDLDSAKEVGLFE